MTASGEKLLENRVALITGGARGIGLAIAKRFAAEGARIALADSGVARDGTGPDASVVEAAAKELREGGAEVLAFAIDVADRAALDAVVASVEKQWSTLDIAVNSAGIIADEALLRMTEASFEGVVRAHVLGAFHVTQAFAQLCRKQKKGGAIINLVSVSGLLGNVGQANESTAKGGVYGLTRTASIELQKYGITVNAIAAIARTRMTEDLPLFEKVHGTMEPEHVAPVALYLASELSEGLSGVVLSVAGGRISTISLTESQGRIKDADGGIWTPAEIAEHYSSIAKK